jgi:hypothetical protein
MPSPFPGMDPYLEAPDIFPGVHNSLAVRIQAVLNGVLPAHYYAKLESRAEVGIGGGGGGDAARRRVPDVAVVRGPNELPAASAAVLVEPAESKSRSYDVVAQDEALDHLYVEVRDRARDHRLVTLIEIVSRSNKEAGRDRRAYLQKQREVLANETNTVELDLLRRGRRAFATRTLEQIVDAIDPPKDYLVLVSRYWRRRGNAVGYQVFPFGLRDPLPEIAVPLREHEDEVPLDLQAVFAADYDAGPFRRGAVDYQRPPDPPLAPDDAAWADQLLRMAGLRGAA